MYRIIKFTLLLLVIILFHSCIKQEIIRASEHDTINEKLVQKVKGEKKGLLLVKIELEDANTWRTEQAFIRFYKRIPTNEEAVNWSVIFFNPILIPVPVKGAKEPESDIQQEFTIQPEFHQILELPERDYFYQMSHKAFFETIFHIAGGYFPDPASLDPPKLYEKDVCIPSEKILTVCPKIKIRAGEVTELVIKPSKRIEQSRLHQILRYFPGIIFLNPITDFPIPRYRREYTFEIRNPVAK